jgi:hypothetical protein
MKTLILLAVSVPGFGLALCQLLADAPAAGKPAPAAPALQISDAEMLQMFSRRIQPILLNGCGTGACHGGSKATPYVLLRPLNQGQPTPALTRQNLQRTLALIDPENSPASPLLKKALATHGGATRSPLGSREAPAYRTLEEWVLKVAPPRKPVSSASAASSAEPTKAVEPDSQFGVLNTSRPPGGAEPVPAAEKTPAPSNAPRPDRPANKLENLAGTLLGPPGAGAAPFSTPKPEPGNAGRNPEAPVDPWDPMIFNRLVHPPRPPDRSGTATPEPTPSERSP